VGAAVVSRVDASPVLEAGEEVLDAVPLLIEDGVERWSAFAALLSGDAGGDAALGERVTEPARVIGPVAEHRVSARQGIDHGDRADMVAPLSLGQVQQQRSALAVTHDVELGGQSAAAAADTPG
jgi:hypothetical protein